MTTTAAPRRLVRTVLVDDTADLRLLLRLALEARDGFVVVAEAGDGREGIEAVDLTRPDLVLLDLAMPTMDGLEALPRIRASCPEATIVVLSGFEGDHLGPTALLAGADAYIRKGASPAEIVSRVCALRDPSGTPEPAFRSPYAPPDVSGPDVSRPEPTPGYVVDPDVLTTLVTSGPLGVLRLSTAEPGTALVLDANPVALRLLGRPRGAVPPDPWPLTSASPPLAESLRHLDPEDADDAGDRIITTDVETGAGKVDVWVCGDAAAPTLVLLPRKADDDSERLRGVIARTAHEIRNPITILTGATDALVCGRGRLDAQTEDRLFDAVGRQARLLDQATADLLAASRHHHGALEVVVEDIELLPVLRGVVAGQPDAGAVAVRCPAGVRVRADAARLEQMLNNLLSNAAKYGAPPYVLDVVGGPGTIGIAVRDAGPGVSADFVDQLFDEFTREGGRSAPGTGLGLFIVRTLAAAQGGTVTYAPVPSGGAEFLITLPAAVAAAAEPAPSTGAGT